MLKVDLHRVGRPFLAVKQVLCLYDATQRLREVMLC